MMGKNTGIEWTTHTWNPWRGCHKVSQGCKNCYMFREQKRYGNDPDRVVRCTKATFMAPRRWKDPAMVFACSWSDWFIEEADEWRDEAWEIIRMTPHLIYQIPTKRPENIRSRLPWNWGDGWSNVWLGVSIESYEQQSRGDVLAGVPAKVRFISAEPLLNWIFMPHLFWEDKFHWVIVGGESGPNCRPMDLQWARDIRDACKKADVPFFMKQMGGHPDKHGEIPPDLQVFEFPKGASNV